MIKRLFLYVIITSVLHTSLGCTKSSSFTSNINNINDMGKIVCNSKKLTIDCNKQHFKIFFDNHLAVLNEKLRPHLKGRAYALVIGINSYNLGKAWELNHPVAEAKRMKKILNASGYTVKILTDQEATRENILDWLNCFACVGSIADRILIYYSGHGTTQQIYIPCEERKSLQLGTLNNAHIEIKDFCIIPYQENNFGRKNPYDSVVGNREIAQILEKSLFSEKILIIDACHAREKSSVAFNPVPIYAYDLQRQGYVYLCMFKDKNRDGEFSPIIFRALEGEANRHPANDDDTVSMFELITFINKTLRNKLQKGGATDNTIKYIMYGSGDIPLTIINSN